MKKYLALLSILVVLCMSISMVALGAPDAPDSVSNNNSSSNEYELPKIPLNGSSSSEDNSNPSVNNDPSGDNNSSSNNSSLPESDSEFETPGVPMSDVTTAKPKVSLSKCTVSGIANKTYTGKALTQKITVKYGKKTLVNKTDYTVTYKNNTNVGTATVTITGKGSYKDKITKTFKINPKNTTLSKVTSPKSKQIKATWKKYTTQTTGYQVQIATNAAFTKNAKTVTVSKNKTTSTVIKKLKGKKKYYVRLRTYKTVGKTKYYSSWTKAKTVTTKK